MSTKERINWGVLIAVATAMLGWAFTGFRTYADDTGDLKQRLSIVETKEDGHTREYEQLRQDLGEIRTDVKHLLERR
jgi:hypothetical protein